MVWLKVIPLSRASSLLLFLICINKKYIVYVILKLIKYCTSCIGLETGLEYAMMMVTMPKMAMTMVPIIPKMPMMLNPQNQFSQPTVFFVAKSKDTYTKKINLSPFVLICPNFDFSHFKIGFKKCKTDYTILAEE